MFGRPEYFVTCLCEMERTTGFRTRDPHLGNAKRTVRRVRPSPPDVGSCPPVRPPSPPTPSVPYTGLPPRRTCDSPARPPSRATSRSASGVTSCTQECADSPWRVDRSDTHIAGSERACRHRRIWAPQISLTWSGERSLAPRSLELASKILTFARRRYVGYLAPRSDGATSLLGSASWPPRSHPDSRADARPTG